MRSEQFENSDGPIRTQNRTHGPLISLPSTCVGALCFFSLHCFPDLLSVVCGDQSRKIQTGVLWKMSNVVRAALRSKCTGVCTLVQRSHGLPVRCFSTEAEQPPQNSTAPPPFLHTDNSGVTYGRLLGIRKHVLKTDIISFLEGCNLTLEDVKIEYNRSFFPLAMMLQFPTRNSYDNAIRVVVRKGRLYKLERADRSHWDYVTPYDGKTILIQGIPRAASFEDVARVLSGCEYDASSINMFLRPGEGVGADPIKMATIRFHSRTQAMNAYITKNGTFCVNNRIFIQVLQ